MHMKKTTALCILFLAYLAGIAQVDKAPAYPLVTHDPYFSIWSFTDKLNESTTRHWTGKDHSMIGMVRVDGKAYKFMGQPQGKLKELAAISEDKPYSSRYVKTKPTGNWIAEDYKESDWTQGTGMAGSKATGAETVWDERDIWIRRWFNVLNTDDLIEPIMLVRHDDNVEIYLNGEKIYSAGCCSNGYKEISLSKQIIAKLHRGANLLAIYCENTGGPGFVDVGIYDRQQPLATENAI